MTRAKKPAKSLVWVGVGDFDYQVEIEADLDKGGFVATAAGLKGCITDGDTLREVLANTKDAIRCWLNAQAEMKAEGIEVPVNQRRRRRLSGPRRSYGASFRTTRVPRAPARG